MESGLDSMRGPSHDSELASALNCWHKSFVMRKRYRTPRTSQTEAFESTNDVTADRTFRKSLRAPAPSDGRKASKSRRAVRRNRRVNATPTDSSMTARAAPAAEPSRTQREALLSLQQLRQLKVSRARWKPPLWSKIPQHEDLTDERAHKTFTGTLRNGNVFIQQRTTLQH